MRFLFLRRMPLLMVLIGVGSLFGCALELGDRAPNGPDLDIVVDAAVDTWSDPDQHDTVPDFDAAPDAGGDTVDWDVHAQDEGMRCESDLDCLDGQWCTFAGVCVAPFYSTVGVEPPFGGTRPEVACDGLWYMNRECVPVHVLQGFVCSADALPSNNGWSTFGPSTVASGASSGTTASGADVVHIGGTIVHSSRSSASTQ